MKVYLWKNVETGELVETDSYNQPPELEGTWVREYSFGLGPVGGAGGSPSRSFHVK